VLGVHSIVSATARVKTDYHLTLGLYEVLHLSPAINHDETHRQLPVAAQQHAQPDSALMANSFSVI
jgi:hypothetical protein